MILIVNDITNYSTLTGIKKRRPFQIQIVHSLLYYFDCSNRFELMVRKNTRLLLIGQNSSKKYI